MPVREHQGKAREEEEERHYRRALQVDRKRRIYEAVEDHDPDRRDASQPVERRRVDGAPFGRAHSIAGRGVAMAVATALVEKRKMSIMIKDIVFY